MPIPIQNTINPVIPNTVKYDLSISSRISDGKLLVSVSVCLRPCKCDIIDGKEVYTDCFVDYPKGWSTGDLEQYAVQNPDMAADIMAAWTAISGVIAKINAREQLL